ncbi:mannose-1-phosphate guanyltransferase [Sphingomonas ginkgonis]|uniref:Mannose-1-phosphate guanyltransferase n=1 Tax=Sphingomonas ginkgonis TaxID=2315330 RepID=A0A3R9Z5R3_9SPHN|nr:sugar phosphate nucleotidyltransferase [Sphingomonas ginkgonis]RST30386.1 mannose-1-phosphate guanyltransferase [Sphingomonas ginkgonis]
MDFNLSRATQSCTDSEASGVERGSTANAALFEHPVVPVVLSGGGGTRLWPLSTEEVPKQFLPLTGPTSLFQEALSRVADRGSFREPIVVSSARHRDLCQAALSNTGDGTRVILEPFGRNTAAAIAMAAETARGLHGGDALLLVMPSDHVIEDVCAFHAAIVAGEAAAREGRLVTFGIVPASPETGYGYIRMGQPLSPESGARQALRFVEKPPLADAKAMVADGQYLWNAGIFLFRADAILAALETYAPAIAAAAVEAITAGGSDGCSVLPNEASLAACPSEPIDTAVMERSDQVAVVPMSPGWSDLGSWDALADLGSSGAKAGPVTLLDSSGCYVRSDGPEIAAYGVDNLIIVAAGNRILVMPRGRSQEIRSLLAAMPISHGPR